MKTIIIISSVLVIALLIIQILAMRGRRNIENYPYEMVKKFDKFEIRNYEASLFTTVKIGSKDYKVASSRGFSVLAGYIFGGNDANQKIAMTSPVAMSLEDSMTVMFMVPKNYKKETLPKPDQSEINFREEPAKTVAAISFGGWADSEKIDNYKNILTAELDAFGINYTNRFFYLGYNPPYELVNRKNEIIVELSSDYRP